MSSTIVNKIIRTCGRLIGSKKEHRTAAVVLAAGKSERMNDKTISKQLYPIDGKPVVVHTLLAFEQSTRISEIVVVSTAEEIALYEGFKEKYGITKLRSVTLGGDTRARSAQNGFERVSKDCDLVAIHDAARCLITTEDIDRVIEEAYRCDAAIAARRMTDTVKVADEEGFIKASPDRSLLWAAQTPQVFKKTLYEVALALQKELDKTITDDAMLVAQTGSRIKLVECKYDNMKITSKNDLALAEGILVKRKGGVKI